MNKYEIIGQVVPIKNMEKKQIKKAWIKFWKEKVNYQDIEEMTGLPVLHPDYELKFWEDFEKYLDKENSLIP